MNSRILFVLLTAAGGWVFQTVFLYLVPTALPTPHWLLLATLAMASRGRVPEAMAVGFFWGLALDVYGMTAFGTQAWLLALVGFGAGAWSKELNPEKLFTQEALAFAGTAVFLSGVVVLGWFFRPTSAPGHVGLGLAAAQVFLNGLVAPAVFWGVTAWIGFWGFSSRNADA